jgi:hypothetical protein
MTDPPTQKSPGTEPGVGGPGPVATTETRKVAAERRDLDTPKVPAFPLAC